MEPRTVEIDGHEWEVGEDGTLRDRRTGPRLERRERLYRQLMRLCGSAGEVGPVHHRLVQEGLMDALGRLTPEGKLLADVLLS